MVKNPFLGELRGKVSKRCRRMRCISLTERDGIVRSRIVNPSRSLKAFGRKHFPNPDFHPDIFKLLVNM